MITRTRIYQMLAVLGAITMLAAITAVAKSTLGWNAMTVALLYLVVVLAISAFAGLACGLVVALVSGLLRDQGKPIGMLIISRIPLSRTVAEQLAGIVSFLIKHHNQENRRTMRK